MKALQVIRIALKYSVYIVLVVETLEFVSNRLEQLQSKKTDAGK